MGSCQLIDHHAIPVFELTEVVENGEIVSRSVAIRGVHLPDDQLETAKSNIIGQLCNEKLEMEYKIQENEVDMVICTSEVAESQNLENFRIEEPIDSYEVYEECEAILRAQGANIESKDLEKLLVMSSKADEYLGKAIESKGSLDQSVEELLLKKKMLSNKKNELEKKKVADQKQKKQKESRKKDSSEE